MFTPTVSTISPKRRPTLPQTQPPRKSKVFYSKFQQGVHYWLVWSAYWFLWAQNLPKIFLWPVFINHLNSEVSCGSLVQPDLLARSRAFHIAPWVCLSWRYDCVPVTSHALNRVSTLECRLKRLIITLRDYFQLALAGNNFVYLGRAEIRQMLCPSNSLLILLCKYPLIHFMTIPGDLAVTDRTDCRVSL